MSDRMNSSAAFNFLREMEDRKLNEQEDEEMSSDAHKIIFKNSKKLQPKDDDPEPSEKRVRGNKFLMPEYVIGEKKTKKSKREKPTSTKSSKQLKLSHLNEEEDD